MRSDEVERRFDTQVSRLLHDRGAGDGVLVAFSGGLDSTVLLHLLLRAAATVDIRVVAAHLDHAMRPGSEADARWVAELCGGRGVPLLSRRLEAPPAGETEARTRRREFLQEARQESGARYLATGHHADDQAETVLFRVLRGTGPRGLAGIRERTEDGVIRPLLDLWREEVEAYARDRALDWREDPTNLSRDMVRNRLRHDILPRLEREVAPAARRALVRLARLTAEEEAGPPDAGGSVLAVGDPAVSIDVARPILLRYDPAARARILRNLLRRFGAVPGEAGTRMAVQFITGAPSGRELHLPDGVRLRRDLDTIRIERASGPEPNDVPFRVEPEELEQIDGLARIGGRLWRVRASPTGPEEECGRAGSARLRRLPLLVRGWQAGDRIRTSAGTKKLKQVFLEQRVPQNLRHTLPVVTSRAGAVLWVPGVIRAEDSDPGAGPSAMYLSISHD